MYSQLGKLLNGVTRNQVQLQLANQLVTDQILNQIIFHKSIPHIKAGLFRLANYRYTYPSMHAWLYTQLVSQLQFTSYPVCISKNTAINSYTYSYNVHRCYGQLFSYSRYIVSMQINRNLQRYSYIAIRKPIAALKNHAAAGSSIKNVVTFHYSYVSWVTAKLSVLLKCFLGV